jgi:hypothetical protein
MSCHKLTRCYNRYASHSSEYSTEVFCLLWLQLRAERGSRDLHNWLPLCNSILWDAGTSAVPFRMEKQSTLTEIKENISYLLGIVFFGFIYSIGILTLLSMVLNWTLGIDITEFDKSYRLILLVWGLCVVGQHFYFKHDEERKIEAQLELLRQGKSVSYPRPTLMERWEKEKKNYEHTN